jgi:hypothetical protein
VRILVETIDRYGIRDKVGWFTADNASNNDTTLREFGNVIDPNRERWNPTQRRVWCMEHSLHLAAHHFIETIAPMSTKTLRGNDRDGNGSDDDENTFDMADALGKALALVNQVLDISSFNYCALIRSIRYANPHRPPPFSSKCAMRQRLQNWNLCNLSEPGGHRCSPSLIVSLHFRR